MPPNKPPVRDVDTPHIIHALLCLNDPPSFGGGYNARPIDPYWVNWLHTLPEFDKYGYIQTEVLTHRTTYYLWYLPDWLRTEEARAESKAAYDRKAMELMELRYRIERSVLFMIRAGSSRLQAREIIENLYASKDRMPQMESVLRATGFFEPLDEELFREYCDDPPAELKFADPFHGLRNKKY